MINPHQKHNVCTCTGHSPTSVSKWFPLREVLAEKKNTFAKKNKKAVKFVIKIHQQKKKRKSNFVN